MTARKFLGRNLTAEGFIEVAPASEDLSDATVVGRAFIGLTDPNAITFPRINADNTVSALSAADFRTAIGAGTEATLTFSDGLTRTVNTVKNDLITGKAGGQTIYGGTLTTEGLTIRANAADTTTGTLTLNGALVSTNALTNQTCTTTATTTSSLQAITGTVDPSGAMGSSFTYGSNITIGTAQSNSQQIGWVVGSRAIATHAGTGSAKGIRGGFFTARAGDGVNTPGLISELTAMLANVNIQLNATVTNATCVQATALLFGSGIAVTNAIGVGVANMRSTGVTNSYGVYVADQSSGGYAIYTGTGLVRFGDAVSTIGSITAQAASTQDAVALAGRAGGSSSYVATITPTTLTASRTVTLPDASIIVAGSASALTPTYLPYATTGGLLADTAMTYDAGALNLNNTLFTQTATSTTTATSNFHTITGTVDPSGAMGSNFKYGTFVTAASAQTNSQQIGWIEGIHGLAAHYGAGTASGIRGGTFVARAGDNTNTPGLVSELSGVFAIAQVRANASATTVRAVWATGVLSSSGAVGTAIGVNVTDMKGTGVTNSYGVKIEDQSAGGYAIYTGTGRNRFGDVVQLNAVANASPLTGDLWYDSTRKTFVARVEGLSVYHQGHIFRQTASQTIANTTTETTLFGSGNGTLTLPANFLTVGRTVRVRMRGHLSENAGPNATIRIKLGSVTLLTSVGSLPASGLTTAEAELDFEFTCRSTGSSGTVIGSGNTHIVSGAFVSTIDRSLLMTSTATVDTTVANTLDITYEWGAASVNNTITSLISFVEVNG